MRLNGIVSFACLLHISLFSLAPAADKPNGNRLTYLDEPCNPWYPHRDFPKLTTPMWVGEEGVEAVVLLGIDDMRGHEKWEAYLRPILNRLKQIDGRAPVSIFTCSIDPKQPHLQQWLEEGLSLEVHTIDHPCPLLNSGDLAKAKSTVDRCIDLLNEVPNNKPVCFRMPCCDSLNTLSPRFYTEIFNKTTAKGNFLLANSSVMHLFTSDDPALPRELVLEEVDAARRTGGVSPLVDGTTVDANTTRGLTPPVRQDALRERFKKYLPADRFFTNYIENYPYPFVVDRLCWEFPTVLPSDWSAQHRHKPHNPATVEDWKAALDCTVIKQGVFCLVFHPHNWIKPEQINELIDHAVTKHGKKVKFLNFREAVERLNKNVLGGRSLRDGKGNDVGLRLFEFGPGSTSVLGAYVKSPEAKLSFMWRHWSSQESRWVEVPFPDATAQKPDVKETGLGPFGVPLPFKGEQRPLRFAWRERPKSWGMMLAQTPTESGVFQYEMKFDGVNVLESWHRLPIQIPKGVLLPLSDGGDSGLRFIDLDEDGHDDIVFSNHERYGVWLWESMKTGWSRELLSAKRGDKPANEELPPIVRADGSNNGFWVHKRELVWMNEDTAKSKDLVERRSFDQLLANVEPGPKSPEQSLKMMQVKPGYRVELVAAEPLVRDPVAFDWGPDGKLWVAEMADYPLGVGEGEEADGADAKVEGLGLRVEGKTKTTAVHPQPSTIKPQPKGGGRVRFLEDTDGDGKYDKSTVFLDKLNFPNGVMPWRDGVLISAAPEVLFARDTNGDGRADEVKVLLTGFGEGNQQHRVNGFSWGLDNMVHCANGDSGGQIKVVGTIREGEAPAEPASDENAPSKTKRLGGSLALPKGQPQVIDIRGRDFRWNPDTGELDPTSGQTQFGRNRDDFGNWFGNNNANPMYHFVLDDFYTRRSPHVAPPDARKQVSITPGPSPVFPISRTLSRFNDFAMANRFTSANSAMVYRDELLFVGQPFQADPKAPKTPDSKSNVDTRSGQPGKADLQHVFISEPVHNLVHHEVMTADGVTFTSRRADDAQQSEFLASRDNWFRPTQIKTGPDGALYIADMYRQVIEHPQYIPPAMQDKLDLRAGHDKGRIYRVVPVVVDASRIQESTRTGDASTTIRFDKLSDSDLVKALASPNGCRRDLAHRMLFWKLADPNTADALKAFIRREVNWSSSIARLHTIALLDVEVTSFSGDYSILFKDPHPAVRRHMVQMVERLNGGMLETVSRSLPAMSHDPDPFVRMQLAYTLGNPKLSSYGNELGKLLYRERDDKYFVAAAMSSIHERNVAAVVASVFEAAGKEPLPTQLVGTLLNLTSAFGSDAALLSLMESVLNAPANEASSVTLAQMLEGFDRLGVSLSQLKEVSAERLAKVQQRLAERIETARTEIANCKLQIANLKSEAVDQATATVMAALPLLGRMPNERAADAELIGALLVPQMTANLQSAAIGALSRVNHANSATALLSGWKMLTPSLRQQVLDALLSRPAWTDRLLSEIESNAISPAEIDAVRRQRLIGHSNEAIRTRSAKLLDAAVNSDRQKVVAEYTAKLKELKAPGDAARGVDVFKQRQCAACHKLRDIGTQVGSDLVSLTDKSTAALLTAILDPNKAVEAKYLMYAAVTKEGRVVVGMIVAETGNSITLAGPDGKPFTLLRTDIDEFLALNKSFMPEGLELGLWLMVTEPVLTAEAMSDLIAFIQSSGPPPKKFDGNQLEVVNQDPNGSLRLLATNAEIYGKTLVFESHFKNLGYWGSVDDRAVWTINVAKPGKFSVRLNYACDNSTAGNEVVFEVAGQSVKAKIAGTGTWENYQTAILDELHLPAGEHRLTVRAAESLKNHLMDLRELRLTLE